MIAFDRLEEQLIFGGISKKDIDVDCEVGLGLLDSNHGFYLVLCV